MNKYDITITGPITSQTLSNVMASISSLPEDAKKVSVFIDSPGGEVYSGTRIYSAFEALKEKGLIVSIDAGAELKSIAEYIFTAGSDGYRKVGKHTAIVMHSPTSNEKDDAFYYALAKEIGNIRAVIFDSHRKIAKKSITDQEIMDSLKKETFIEAEKYVEMGYADSINDSTPSIDSDISANSASLIDNFNKKMEEKESLVASIEARLKKIYNMIVQEKGSPVSKEMSAIVIQDIRGTQLNFDGLSDGAMPSVGDKATVNGKLAEGSYMFSDGCIYRFVQGILTEIVAPEMIDALFSSKINAEAKIKELEGVNSTLKSKLEELKTEVDSLESKISRVYSEQESVKQINSSSQNSTISNEPINTEKVGPLTLKTKIII